MLRLIAACIGAGAILLLVACGGGGDGDRLLELRGYDIAESDYRTAIRSQFLNPLHAGICPSLVGLSPADVVELADIEDDAPEETPEETPPPGSTVKPDQVGEEGDKVRAAEIILEECDRLGG